MTDTYGSITLFPVPVPVAKEAVGDPVLRLLLDFATAVLNTHVGEAWGAVCPRKKVVEASYPWNPEEEFFTDTGLPALYLHWAGGKMPTTEAAEWHQESNTLLLRWVLPLQKSTVARLRSPIVAAIAKTLDRALYATRDPAFFRAEDTDPEAPTLAEVSNAVMLSRATSSSAVTLGSGGVAFDGPLASSLDPLPGQRGVVITLGGPAGSWVDGSEIVITGEDVLGQETEHAIVIDASKIPGKLYSTQAFTSISSITIEAQGDAGASYSVGLGATRGCGTSLCDFGGIDLSVLKQGVFKPIKVPVFNSKELKVYPAIEWQVMVTERLVRAPEMVAMLAGTGIDRFGEPATPNTSAAASATTKITNPDGVVLANAAFP